MCVGVGGWVGGSVGRWVGGWVGDIVMKCGCLSRFLVLKCYVFT